MKTCLTAVIAIVSSALFADTFTWTGAEDACWTNPANWQVSGAVASRCPGVPVMSDTSAMWTAWESENDTAAFTDAGSARTTIDMDGLHCIKTIEVSGAQTPAYTFGTSADQRIPLRADGSFVLAADAASAPVLTAGLVLGVGARWVSGSSTVHTGVNLVNNSALDLRFGDIFTGAVHPDSPSGKTYYFDFIPGGTGPIALAGSVRSPTATCLIFRGRGTIKIEGDVQFMQWDLYNTGGVTTVQEIEIAEGATFGVPNADNNGVWFRANRGLNVSGAGLFKTRSNVNNRNYRITNLSLHGVSLVVSSAFDVYDSGIFYLFSPDGSNPVVAFTDQADNRSTGPVVWRGKNFALKAASIGANGVKSALGSGSDLHISGDGTLAYTGSGEETTRTITITNLLKQGSTELDMTGAAKGTLSQQGTGPWTVSSEIRPWYVAGSVTPGLVLANSTAFPATLASALSDGPDPFALTKTGTGRWTISGVNAHTGPTTVSAGTLAFAATGSIDASASVVLAGGTTLEFEDSAVAVAKTLKNVSVSGGIAALNVGSGVTLTFDGVPTVAAGSLLDIAVADGAAVVCPAAASTTLPYSKVRANGRPVSFDADGKMAPGEYTPSVRVDVRGGEIASDAAAMVGFNEAGASGPVTLGASAVSVAGIVQDLSTSAATVEVGAGETLSAGILAIDAGAKGLAIGTDRQNGSFAVSSDGLFLENDSEDATLDIRTPLSGSGTLPVGKAGVGDVSLPLGSVFSSSLSLLQGSLVLDDGAGTAVRVTRPDEADAATTLAVDSAAAAVSLTQSVPESAVEVSGTASDARPLALAVSAGEMRLSGAGRKCVSSLTVADGAELTIDGGADVVSGTGAFQTRGTLAISNAVVQNPQNQEDPSGSYVLGSFAVMQNGRASVGEDAVVSNRLCIGCGGSGSLVQSGGTIHSLSHSSGQGPRCSNVGMNASTGHSCGYYRKTGGTLKDANFFWVNSGLFEQTGGTSAFNTLAFSSGNQAAWPHILLTGGTMSATYLALTWSGTSTRGTLTLAGEDAKFSTSLYYQIKTMNNAGTGTVNLNAGTLKTDQILNSSGSSLYVNFNGGTYAGQSGDKPVFKNVSRVTVYENGATIDLANQTKLTAGTALSAAPGNGVASVEMPASTGWAAAPEVEIVGDGTGATACARFDPETGTVSGVLVTSRGWNYTTAKAVLHLPGHEDASYPCTLSANRRGPLTVKNTGSKSSGDITLDKANGFSRFVLERGTVTAGVAGAIPTDADLELTGGTLNMSTNALVFGSLSGTGGTLKGTATDGQLVVTTANPGTGLSGVTFQDAAGKAVTLAQTCNGAWNLAAADVAAGKKAVVSGAFAFGANATLAITGDTTLLNPNSKYTVFEATAGDFTGMPTLTGTNMKGWKIVKSGNAIRLFKPKGLVVVVK